MTQGDIVVHEPDQEPQAYLPTVPALGNLTPAKLDLAVSFAQAIEGSHGIPKEYRDNSAAIVTAVLHGDELGIGPMQALQGIAVIGGRPAVWGDLLLGLCLRSPLCEYVKEWPEHDDDGNVVACVCETKRKGQEPKTQRFTVEMARQAGLLTKTDTWRGYQARMLKMRARSWVLRDTYADLLRGLSSAEEMEDAVAAGLIVDQAPSLPDYSAVEKEYEASLKAITTAEGFRRLYDKISSETKLSKQIIRRLKMKCTNLGKKAVKAEEAAAKAEEAAAKAEQEPESEKVQMYRTVIANAADRAELRATWTMAEDDEKLTDGEKSLIQSACEERAKGFPDDQ